MVKALIKRVFDSFRPKAKAATKPASHTPASNSHAKHAPHKALDRHDKAAHDGETYKPSEPRASRPPRRQQEDSPRGRHPEGGHRSHQGHGPQGPHGGQQGSHSSHQGPHGGHRRPRPPKSHGPGQGHGGQRDQESYTTPPPPAQVIPATPWDPSTFVVEPAEGKTRFHDLDLPETLLHGIADLNFSYCTPIQAQVLPHTLQGKDAYGRAQTGTGKTAAFLLTILTRFMRNPIEGERRVGTPRALIIAPTRELVTQIEKDARGLAKFMPIRVIAVYGGMDYDRQRRMLNESPVDVVVATPGRLIDYKNRGDIHLSKVEILVIDEADRMLDMGFIPDVRNIVHSTPHKGQRQTLFFTATLTDAVKRLADQWTTNPVTVEVAPEEVTVDTVNQMIYIVTLREKFALLYNILMKENAERVILFANRRDQAERLCDHLHQYDISSALLSGAVPQQKRMRVLEDFKAGKIRVLVATDVAGRGIHVDGVSHVINYNLPIDPEDYVHRIGRTGRAGNLGTSISFADEDDGYALPDIEKYIGKSLSCIHPDEEWLKLPPPIHPPVHRERSHHGHGGGGGRPPRRGGGGGRPGGGRGRGGPRSRGP